MGSTATMVFRLPTRILLGPTQLGFRVPLCRSPPISAPRTPLQPRLASHQSFPGRGHQWRQPPVSNRKWTPSRNLVIGSSAGGISFYLYNQETVPVSGRRRFNCFNEEWTKTLVSGEYESLVKELAPRLLPAQHPTTQRVARVVQQLLPSSGLPTNEQWRVHVINAPQEQNAFVLPGGKVFVYSGIIDFAGDDNALAAVLAHEIAHNVCHHVAEKLSNSLIGLGAIYILAYTLNISGGFANTILQLIYNLPQGRIQEAEADAVGLSMMAQSCFDPQAAVKMWNRMEKEHEAQTPQFLSTHPSHHSRVQTLQKLLPEAERKAEESGCRNLRSFQQSFRDAFHQSDHSWSVDDLL